MAEGARLDLRWSTGAGGATVVALAGELDIESADEAKRQLVERIGRGEELVLDLAEVEFMDSSGLGALILVLTKAREVDGSVTAINPPPRVRRLMDTSKVSGLFGLGAPSTPSPATVTTATSRPSPDAASLAEARALLAGFENLLRWGDLRPEQVTLALAGAGADADAVADDTTDLALAARVREVLRRL